MTELSQAAIDAALQRAEEAVARGEGLAGTGFWPAVAAARRDPAVAGPHADRIAAVDRRAASTWALVRIPPRPGHALVAAGLVLGAAALAAAGGLDGSGQAAALLGGGLLLLLSTHAPAHWIAGRLVGIAFTGYFVASLHDPFPGVKIDYATYLRASPRARALMHAAAPVVSKVVPFAVLGVAVAVDAAPAVRIVLLVVGIGQLAVDLAFSTRSGDWSKVLRELRG